MGFCCTDELQKPLDDYLLKLPKVQVLRLQSRVGLIRARLHGFSHVTSEVAIFLDSHCECVEGTPVAFKNGDNLSVSFLFYFLLLFFFHFYYEVLCIFT